MKTECDLQVKERREGAASGVFIVLSFCVQDKNGVTIPPTELSPQVTQCDVAFSPLNVRS